jgi:hypothetical protein
MVDKVRRESILILAKTYPSPSAQYIETSCVAGINRRGQMRRLYPVPFRMIEDSQQFSKWQWIDVHVEKANRDHRPESHRLYVDTIEAGATIESRKGWVSRREWLEKIPTFDSFRTMDQTREQGALSIALLRPKNVRLEIKKARHPDWTPEEQAKLMRRDQGSLFDEDETKRQLRALQKIPFDFHYVYDTVGPSGDEEQRHKIVDWEAGALFRRCQRSHGPRWEEPFRAKLEEGLTGKELMFLMGNQHRFQDQWLIISLIYPPKRAANDGCQPSLF